MTISHLERLNRVSAQYNRALEHGARDDDPIVIRVTIAATALQHALGSDTSNEVLCKLMREYEALKIEYDASK